MKKLLSLLFALVFVLPLAAPVFAQPNSTTPAEHQQLDRKKKKKKKKKHPGEVSPITSTSTGPGSAAQTA